MSCAACSQPLPDGARFCPSCGTPVDAAAVREDERRVVTVVFADLVGYSALSERLDPEQLKRFIDAAFEQLISDIVEFGGRVDKVLGDGILALFGAPIAHEDDAVRAIRAAAAMQASLADFAAERDPGEEPVQLRIGVNTGEVVVGRVVGTDNFTAMGDVVNVAQRLQSMAPPGGIYVGDATAVLAVADVGLQVVDELRVRGREQPERVWRVLQAAPPVSNGAGANAGQVPFVGRTSQRELLRSVMSMVANGQSAIVAVSGEAGAGKTRLVNEALDAFPKSPVALLDGVCAPYGETNPWAPIAQAIVNRLGIDGSRPVEEVHRELVEHGRKLLVDADDVSCSRYADAMLQLLGLPSPLDDEPQVRARETIFQFLIETILRRSATQPVVLWIDDLQWADAIVLDFLARLSDASVGRAVLIITAARDADPVAWPPPSPTPFTVKLPLKPLEREEADRLTELLVDGATPELAERLYNRSGGNPLFHTQLAGVAQSNPDSSELPGTLRALIAAQLDQLDPELRAILDNAAVVGTTGPVGALEFFASQMRQRWQRWRLDQLVGDGWLELDGDRWKFRSDLVREVAYRTLTKAHRAERHAGVAASIRTLPGVPVDRLAHHVAVAAELMVELGPIAEIPPDVTRDAEELLFAAGRRALDVGALSHALRHATRGLELYVRRADSATSSATPTLHRELLLLRSEVQIERHETAAARLDAGEALEAAIAAGDRRHQGRALRLLGRGAQQQDDVATARVHLGRSVDLFRELGDDTELAASLRERGFAEVLHGSTDDADWLLAEAEALSERLDDRRGLAWARQQRAWVSFLAGNTDQAVDRLNQAAAGFSELGDSAGHGWAIGLLAYVRFQRREFDAAEELAERTSEEARAQGDWWAPAMMDSLLASIRLWRGDFDEADRLARRAAQVFRSHDERFGILMATAPHVRALIALGRGVEAERLIEELTALGQSAGRLGTGTIAAAGAAAHLGLGGRAVELAERAVLRLEELGGDASEAATTLALALCQVGRAEEALAVLVRVTHEAPFTAAVRALASVLCGDDVTGESEARAVLDDATASYLDRVLAWLALATSITRTDGPTAADDVLEDAYDDALATGGAVGLALVVGARSKLAGHAETHPSVSLRPGWQRMINDLAAAVGWGTPPAASSDGPAGELELAAE